jgi:hypothetical protein
MLPRGGGGGGGGGCGSGESGRGGGGSHYFFKILLQFFTIFIFRFICFSQDHAHYRLRLTQDGFVTRVSVWVRARLTQDGFVTRVTGVRETYDGFCYG